MRNCPDCHASEGMSHAIDCPQRPGSMAAGGIVESGDPWDRHTGFSCFTCMYFAPKDPVLGRCKRHAPAMDGYPVVYADRDWCGDHKIGSNPSKMRMGNG